MKTMLKVTNEEAFRSILKAFRGWGYRITANNEKAAEMIQHQRKTDYIVVIEKAYAIKEG